MRIYSKIYRPLQIQIRHINRMLLKHTYMFSVLHVLTCDLLSTYLDFYLSLKGQMASKTSSFKPVGQESRDRSKWTG